MEINIGKRDQDQAMRYSVQRQVTFEKLGILRLINILWKSNYSLNWLDFRIYAELLQDKLQGEFCCRNVGVWSFQRQKLSCYLYFPFCSKENEFKNSSARQVLWTFKVAVKKKKLFFLWTFHLYFCFFLIAMLMIASGNVAVLTFMNVSEVVDWWLFDCMAGDHKWKISKSYKKKKVF